MQCSVVKLKEVKNITDFRIDAECFKPVHLRTAELISRLPNATIGQMSRSVINFGAYSLCNYIEFLSEGIPFLVTEDIKNNIIDTDNLHYISKEVHQILYKSHCKPGQVLLTMAGAYLGQAAVYYLDFESSSNQAIAKITLREGTIEPLYLSTFLNCRFGQSQIERFRTGTGQPNLNLGLIQTIKIPIVSTDFQKYVKEVVLQGIKFHTLSGESYKQAEKTLLSELMLVDWKPKHQLSFVKSFSDTKSADRMDAEYHQPMYDELLEKVRHYKNGYKLLGDIVTIRKCIEPGSQAYEEKGIPFLRVSNLSKFGINSDNQQYISEDLYERLSTYQPEKGEILLSKDATPGIAYYLRDVPSKMIPSSGILRLTVKDTTKIIPEYLTLVLNSVIVQKQVERDVGGSVINHWLVDQVKKTLIPILPESIQKDISDKVADSFMKREQSKKLLDIARRGVEMAIEQNEQEAEKWLNKEVNHAGGSVPLESR
jgi:type I restriction enzyme S subunit